MRVSLECNEFLYSEIHKMIVIFIILHSTKHTCRLYDLNRYYKYGTTKNYKKLSRSCTSKTRAALQLHVISIARQNIHSIITNNSIGKASKVIKCVSFTNYCKTFVDLKKSKCKFFTYTCVRYSNKQIRNGSNFKVDEHLTLFNQ